MNLYMRNVSISQTVGQFGLTYHLTDPGLVLCFPRQKNPEIPTGLRSKILAALVTRFNTT